jgi:thiamine-phosphate pyrophosphorylase
LRAAAEIASVFEGVGATLILNDRADLAVLAGWDGVHVGQGDLPVEAAKRVLGNPTHRAIKPHEEWGTRHVGADGSIEIQGSLHYAAQGAAPVEMTWCRAGVVGLSTHNEEQVLAADNSAADYIAVGPVFRTATKHDAEPVIGLEGVRRARELTRKPIVAIGGITVENAASVAGAGADSVAVIGGLFVPGRRVRDVAEELLRVLRSA